MGGGARPVPRPAQTTAHYDARRAGCADAGAVLDLSLATLPMAALVVPAALVLRRHAVEATLAAPAGQLLRRGALRWAISFVILAWR